MATDIHSPSPEDLMAYLDGEGTPAARAAIEAHLTTCAACQARATGHAQLSHELAAWDTPPAPSSLRAPSTERGWWALTAWLFQPRAAVLTLSALGVVAVLATMTASSVKRAIVKDRALRVSAETEATPAAHERIAGRGRPALPPSAAQPAVGSVLGGLPGSTPAPPPPDAAVPRGAAVIRLATLKLVARNFPPVRASVEAAVAAADGFVMQLSVSGDPGAARELRATLRVPGDRLTGTLARLRQLGLVVEDTQGAEDVADQLVDLDARLVNARATEKRLSEILQTRTGRLSDVLEVEREIARVRLDIERLDAEKKNLSRRVAYATIELTISEERKAGLDPGPLPLLTQLRLAAADGLQNVFDTVVGVALFALRAGPSLLLWGLAATLVWVSVRRRGSRSRASE
jgi:hypothetical protein